MGWQDTLIRQAEAELQGDADVVALAVFGSGAGGTRDAWSDVDLLLVVNEGAIERFHPSVDWLTRLGEVYTYEQSAGEFTRVTRVCFSDLRRLDAVITTEPALLRIDRWPGVPFWSGARVLFSRSRSVARILSQPHEPPHPPPQSHDEFEAWARSFWFRGAVATGKVVRGDLLIALHLALEMAQDCLVLGMMLRDRAEGTSVHCEGGIGNQRVDELAGLSQPFTAAGILTLIEHSAVAFDALAAQWSDGYDPHREPLLRLVREARTQIDP